MREVLAHPNADERRNKYDAASLTEYLRSASGTDVEFRREILLRAVDRERAKQHALDALEDDTPARERRAAETELREAQADVAAAREALHISERA